MCAWVRTVLIVDDKTSEASILKARLHLVLGYDIAVVHAKSLGQALDSARAGLWPDVILLDDVLPPADRAPSSIAFLRKAGHRCPVIVVGGQITAAIGQAAKAAGAADVIHKDDLDTERLTEALCRLSPPQR